MTDGTVQLNGISLYYQKYGGGKPLILLHGNGEDGRIFDAVAKKLGGKFAVYVPDSRGHGKSSAAPLNYAAMAEDMRQFIAELNLENPMFYGFSDGGIIGLILSSRHPGLLGKLAVSGVNLNPKALKFSFRFPVRLAHFFTRSTLLKLMLTEPDIKLSDLSGIQEPVLVLAGEKDIIPRKHTQTVAAAIPYGTYRILKGENHFSYVKDNDKLYGVLNGFFTEED